MSDASTTDDDQYKWPFPVGVTIFRLLAGACFCATYGYSMLSVTAIDGDLPGVLHTTSAYMYFVLAAFFGTVIPGIVLLFKFRIQFGMRIFCWVGVALLLFASLSHWFVYDLSSAIFARIMAGFGVSTVATCGITYFATTLPKRYSVTGSFALGLMFIQFFIGFSKVIVVPQMHWERPFEGVYYLPVALAFFNAIFLIYQPLPESPTQKVFDWWDLISFPLMWAGIYTFASVMIAGESFWWVDNAWVGYALAFSFGCITLFLIIENVRKYPFVRIDWLFSPQIMGIFVICVFYRFLMSGQTIGPPTFFDYAGLRLEQTQLFYTLNSLSMVVGFFSLLFFFRVDNIKYSPWFFLTLSLFLSTIASYFTAWTSPLSRGPEIQLQQCLLNFAAALVLPVIQVLGLGMSAKQKEPNFSTTTYLVVFLSTQLGGAMVDIGIAQTFFTFRGNFHTERLWEQIVPTDPIVAARVLEAGAAVVGPNAPYSAKWKAGLEVVYEDISTLSNYMSFNDFYYALAVTGMCGICVVILIYIFIFLKTRYGPKKQGKLTPSGSNT